jgi:hypothetical protein
MLGLHLNQLLLAMVIIAAMIVKWLADFRASTGKGAAYMAGHAGTFAATRTDGGRPR